MKTKFFSLFGALAICVFGANLYADYEANADPDTLIIYDTNINNDNYNLYELFNNYFGTNYESSQALYEDRGVNSSGSWIASDGAAIVSSFKNALLEQTLNVVNSNTGDVVASHVFGTSFDKALTDGTILNLDAGLYEFTLEAAGELLYGADSSSNADGLIHMIALDVTDLIQAMYGDENINSAYLFGWEDLLSSNWYADFDYQDLAYLMINVQPESTAATPEPGTVLIFGLGLVGAALAGRRLRRKED